MGSFFSRLASSFGLLFLLIALSHCGGGGGNTESPLDPPADLAGDWVTTLTITSSTNYSPVGSASTTIMSVEQHGSILSIDEFSTCHVPQRLFYGRVSAQDFTLSYEGHDAWLPTCNVGTVAEYALTLAADGTAMGTGKITQTFTGPDCWDFYDWVINYSITMTRCDAGTGCPWVPCAGS